MKLHIMVVYLFDLFSSGNLYIFIKFLFTFHFRIAKSNYIISEFRNLSFCAFSSPEKVIDSYYFTNL